ncbi:MAG: TIGR02679 family protein [Christensenellales bacterium]|jgi:uncharacterized protein (TIGR02679 family)
MKKEDLDFIKAKKGYHRLFLGFRKKYKSLGRIGGTVKLTNLTSEEKEVLSSHFRKDYSGRHSAGVSVLAFERSLENTRFYGLALKDILEAYFNEAMTGKKEDEKALELQRNYFFSTLLSDFPSGKARLWLERIYDGSALGVRTVVQKFSQEEERDKLYYYMTCVCKALNALPGDKGHKKRLPVFSSQITKNPHGFDLGTFGGNMLLNALCTVYDIKEQKDSLERAQVYYRAGILIDEISNYVTISGLLAFQGKSRDPVWKAALEAKQVLQVPLLNLSKIDKVESPIKKVFVIENPGVFGTIIDKNLFPPMVCTFGQPKLSGLVLLDLLAESDTQIFYSGDFDPEGLQIADSLWRRYGYGLKLWYYDVEDYKKAMSRKTLSEKRLSILENINCPGLQEVAEVMKMVKKAGYQELLIDDLTESLRQLLR